jgi:hypothetical protein
MTAYHTDAFGQRAWSKENANHGKARNCWRFAQDATAAWPPARTTGKRKARFVNTFGALCIKKRRRFPANSRLPELA